MEPNSDSLKLTKDTCVNENITVCATTSSTTSQVNMNQKAYPENVITKSWSSICEDNKKINRTSSSTNSEYDSESSESEREADMSVEETVDKQKKTLKRKKGGDTPETIEDDGEGEWKTAEKKRKQRKRKLTR